VLRDHLRRYERREIHLVFAALRDKDIRSMGSHLFPLARSIHLAPVANPRTADTSEIAAAHPRHQARLRIHGRASEALLAAWAECPRDGLTVVTGSLYLLGELLPILRRLSGSDDAN
jgi:dihydrofolate synthase/folylpolyglutamate synthase